MTTVLYRIFGFVDERDERGVGHYGTRLLYVGITDDYGRRMRQHAEKKWWKDIEKVTVQKFPSRVAAAEAEKVAIREELPLHNRIHSSSSAQVAAIPRARSHRESPESLLSIAEAAAYLAVNPKTIRRRIADGSLPAFRSGKRLIRVRRVDVEHLLRPIACVGGRA